MKCYRDSNPHTQKNPDIEFGWAIVSNSSDKIIQVFESKEDAYDKLKLTKTNHRIIQVTYCNIRGKFIIN